MIMNSGVFEAMHRSANNRFQDTSLRFYRLKQSADVQIAKQDEETESSVKALAKTRSKSTSSYAPSAKTAPLVDHQDKENKAEALENGDLSVKK